MTVSVSSFVPKSHTSFQWFGQLPIEEIERKQQYIKGLIRDKHISYHYHDAKTGRLEATFARGDRRMGKVLYEPGNWAVNLTAGRKCSTMTVG